MITFSKIPGQPLAKRILLSSINGQKVASTYLFYGNDGMGKWATAVAYAALLNCEKPVRDGAGQVVDVCNECRNCHQIGNLAFPDLYFAVPLTPFKNDRELIDITLDYLEQKRQEPYKIVTTHRQQTIPVEVARDIKKRTSVRPPAGVRRVILFYQMERMLPASADSLLKLIEEPPLDTVVILTANDPVNLLPTIQSRAQRVPFKPIPESEIASYFEESHQLEASKATLYAHLSAGSLGKALDYASEEGDMSLRQTSFLLLKQLLTRDNPSAAASVSEMINPGNRGETESVLAQWQSFLSDLILLKYGGNSTEVRNVDFASELAKLVVKMPEPEGLCLMADEIREVAMGLRRNIHIRPAMTALVFKMRRYLNETP